MIGWRSVGILNLRMRSNRAASNRTVINWRQNHSKSSNRDSLALYRGVGVNKINGFVWIIKRKKDVSLGFVLTDKIKRFFWDFLKEREYFSESKRFLSSVRGLYCSKG